VIKCYSRSHNTARLYHGFGSTHGAVLKGPAVSGMVTNFRCRQVLHTHTVVWRVLMGISHDNLAAEHNYITNIFHVTYFFWSRWVWCANVLKWPWIIWKWLISGALPHPDLLFQWFIVSAHLRCLIWVALHPWLPPTTPCFNITAEQQFTSYPDMMSRKYRTHLKMPLFRHFRQGSSKLEKNQRVNNWVRGVINWTSSTQVKYSIPIFFNGKI
jgi:hypothetical protein